MPERKRPEHLRFDRALTDIADYVCRPVTSRLAYQTAHLCLLDALGCGLAALGNPACARLLGPVVPGTIVPHGAKVPGTQFQLDPVTAAANIGTMIRWLDFNDTWLAAEWGHPSDNLGAILATADWLSRTRRARGRPPLTMRDVLTALIQAYEIQGVIALENSFNRLGFDHVLLVKVASTAVAARLMGGGRAQIVNALSNAWIDGPTLRVYRHAPNTGSRKSWASGDATSRAVQLALMALKGEMGYPTALTAKRWGFYDAFFAGAPFRFPQKYASYIVENILFKVSFPAEFHAQTAVECAIELHPEVRQRLDDIDKVIITTQQSALLVIDKNGPLRNPADRDHCMQYMVAIGLLKGNIVATDYEDEAAADPRIDRLRAKMTCVENKQWTRDHDDPAKRTITNGVQVFFADGAKTRQVVIEYPLGHRGRRREATPLILAKFRENIGRRLPQQQREHLYALCQDKNAFARMAVDDFIDTCVI